MGGHTRDGAAIAKIDKYSGLYFRGTANATMVGSTTTIVSSELTGMEDDFFNDKYYMQILRNANAVGTAPELEVQLITNYVSTTGTFTTDAFTVNVEANDELFIMHESLVMVGRDDANNVFASTNVVANADGSSLERLEWIQVALGGGAIQLRVEQSKSGAVEEDAFLGFAISLFDIDTGAVQVADIDITGIVTNLEKSTGGAAFSNAGITQPVFAKANGLVSIDYRFLAAEWEIGDTYRLQVSGITCTVAGDTSYVKDVVWSNLVTELVNVEAKVDAILVDTSTTLPAEHTAILTEVLTNLTLQETGGTLTGDGTEQDVYVREAPPGVFSPKRLYIDLDAMLAGDTTVIREYYRLEAGGGMILMDSESYTGADGGLLDTIKGIVIDLTENRFGVTVTLEETVAGTRDYTWEPFEEVL